MTRKDDYHIRVKNLKTWKDMGFMLTSGDKPFTIQGMDNQATRVSEGELLYSDFTNSRVFAQSDWGNGVSKYWNPERFYSTIYPSRQYGDANNIYIGNGEFSLGNGVEVAEDFSGTNAIQSYCNGESPWVVYAAQKTGLKIYRSTDYGMTWTTWKDLLAVPYTDRFTGYTGFADMKFCNTAYGASGGDKVAGEGGQYLWFIATKNDGSSLTGRITIRIPYKYHGYARAWNPIVGNWTLNVNLNPNEIVIQPNENYGAITATINTDKSIGSATTYATYTLTWTYDGVSRSHATCPLFWGTWPEEPLFVPWQQIRLVGGATTYRTITGKIGNQIWIDWDYSSGTFDCTVYPWDVIVVPVSSASGDSTRNADVLINNLFTSQFGLRFSTTLYDYCVIGALITWTGATGTTVLGNTFTPYTTGTDDWDLGSSYLIIRNIYSGSSAFDFMGVEGTTYLPPYSSFIWQQEQVPYKYSKLFVTNNSGGDEVFVNNNLTTEWNIRTLGRQTISGVSKLGYNNIYGTGNLIYNWDTKNNLDFTNYVALDLGIGYYAVSSTTDWNYTTYIGTQFGTDEYGTQAKIYSVAEQYVSSPSPAHYVFGGDLSIDDLQTFWEQSISAMHHAFGYYWVATNLKGNIYQGIPNSGTVNFEAIIQLPRIGELGSTYIDSITDYNGKIVLSYQKWAGVYSIDPIFKYEPISSRKYYAADALCSLPITPWSSVRITNLLNTGRRLLIGTNQAVELYSFSNGTISSIGYMQSSIYGWYISNVAKLWQYVYVRVNPETFDNLQKIAFEVSFDDNATWQFIPKNKWLSYFVPSSPSDPVWDHAEYYHTKVSTPTYVNDNKMLVFFFPYNQFQNTIAYRCWLKTGASTKRLTINHIGVHFNVAYRQEMLINYNISMKPRDELLDGRRADIFTNNDRLTFLKDIWQNMYQVEITHVDGKKYVCIPFSDDRTPGQGYVLTTQNASSARQDFDNLEYNLLFTLKTIANFSEIL